MTQELIKQEASIAIATPNQKRRGFEDFDMEELIVPRLRLLQAMSDSVKDGTAKAGEFQDSLTGEILGDQVEVVLLNFRNGAIYLKPGEGLKCRSNNGVMSINGDTCAQCPFDQYHKEFKQDGEPPKCSSTKEFIAVTKKTLAGKEQKLFAITFMKTSYKNGRKLASMAYLAGGDIFRKSYKITNSLEASKKGDYYLLQASTGSELNEQEFKSAERWFNIFYNTNVVVAGDEVDASEAAHNGPIHEEV